MTNPVGKGTELNQGWFVVSEQEEVKPVSVFDPPPQDGSLANEKVDKFNDFHAAATGEKESPTAQQEEQAAGGDIAERLAVREGQVRSPLALGELQQGHSLLVAPQEEPSPQARIVEEPRSCFQDELDKIQSEIASREDPSVIGQALVPFTVKDILPSSVGNFGMPEDPDERWEITPRLVGHFITQAKEEVTSTVMAKFEERFAAYAKHSDEQQSVFVQRLGHVLRLKEAEFDGITSRLRGENAELRGEITQLKSNNEALQGRIEVMGDEIVHLTQENGNLKGQITSLTGRLESAEEGIQSRDHTIGNLEQRFNDLNVTHNNLQASFEDLRREKIASDEQQQRLIADLERQLRQTDTELEQHTAQLQQAQAILRQDNGTCRFWSKVGVSVVGILAAPTVIVPMKAVECIEEIDESFNTASQTVLRETREIAALNSRKDVLLAQIAANRAAAILRGPNLPVIV